MTKAMTQITSKENLTEIIEFLEDWMDGQGIKNLMEYVKHGHVELIMPECNPEQDLWDGTLLVKLLRPFSAREVVNYIAAFAHSDEMSFEDDNTLRLWWD